MAARATTPDILDDSERLAALHREIDELRDALRRRDRHPVGRPSDGDLALRLDSGHVRSTIDLLVCEAEDAQRAAAGQPALRPYGGS
jgi:hypothetical protein